MISPTDVTAVILLTGENGIRSGSDSTEAVVEEELLLQRVLALVSPLCNKIYMSGNNPESQTFAYPQLPDIIAGLGPIGVVYAGLRQTETPYVLFLPGNMPFLEASVLQRILENDSSAEITLWERWDGSLELFPSLYSRSVYPFVEWQVKHNQLAIRDLFSQTTTRLLQMGEE